MSVKFCASLAIAMFLAAQPVSAQHGGHAGHGSHAGHGASTAANPAAKAFDEANRKMHRDMSFPLTGHADHDFVRGMLPHHQGAVEMSEIIQRYGKDHAIHGLANSIIKAQIAEIEQMKAWLAKNPTPVPQPESAEIKAAYNAANAKMHAGMTIKATDNPDKDFLRGMIPHHEGAVEMAKVLQKYGKDAELQKLAANIIESQTKEIAEMKTRLSAK